MHLVIITKGVVVVSAYHFDSEAKAKQAFIKAAERHGVTPTEHDIDDGFIDVGKAVGISLVCSSEF